VLYLFYTCWKEHGVSTLRYIEFVEQVRDRGRHEEYGQRPASPISAWRCSVCCVVVVVSTLVAALAAQDLSAPPRLAPTSEALNKLQKCGKSIAKNAPKISSKILESENLLAHGLLIGWNNPSGEFAAVPPPKEYVEDLAQESEWCLEVADALNTQPENKERAEKVLTNIAYDLYVKVEDCRSWGMGRLITVKANTVKNGQPDPGWTVNYKWMSSSGLNSVDLSFPAESTPTTKKLPPGMYAIYATKQIGGTLKKTEPITITAFQKDTVQCDISVP
jgi:hypothetical protein